MKLYTKFVDEWLKSAFIGDTTSELRDTVSLKLLLVDSTYTFNIAHDYLDDVPASARIATAVAVSGVSVSFGVVDCTSPVTFTSVSGSEDDVAGLVLYDDTGVEGTSILYAYFGSEEVEGLVLSPNGADIRFNVSDGTDKLFRLIYQTS